MDHSAPPTPAERYIFCPYGSKKYLSPDPAPAAPAERYIFCPYGGKKYLSLRGRPPG